MRHKGSIRQRSEDTYGLRYSLGTDPLTGKQKRIDVTFKGSYKEAKVELLRLAPRSRLHIHRILSSALTHEFIKAITKLPNLPRVRFHDLRHSHATQLLTAGIHPKIAQERLGHSTITTTMDLYSHVTDTMQDDAAAKLDTAFRSAIKARSSQKPELS
ncbi:MAG: tyrosine-type recombinase/integrase [Alphaproteobacteria bacterium]